MVNCGTPSLQTLYSLVAAVFVSTLGVGVFAFAVPLLALTGQKDGLMLGVAFSGYFLAKFFISPLAGHWSDNIGPKPLLVISSLLGVVAPLAVLGSVNQDLIYIVQICLGLSTGIMKPVATASIGALFPEQHRGRIFGWCNACYNVAFFLGPILGGLLYFHRNLSPVLLFLVACMAVCLGVIVLFTPPRLTTTICVFQNDSWENIKKSTLNPKSWPLLTAICGRTICTASLVTFYPVLLAENLHGPTWLVGLLFALPSLVTCMALPLGGWLADRMNRGWLTVAGLSLSALCFGVTGYMTTAPGFIVCGMFLGMGAAVSFPASMALASGMGVHQGRIMGWFHGAANAGFVLGPVLCGLLVETFGGLDRAMALVGLVGLFSIFPLALHQPAVSWAWCRRAGVFTVLGAGVVTVVMLCLFAGGVRQASQASSFQEPPLKFAGVAMGNVVHMRLCDVDPVKGATASGAAFDTIARLEAQFDHRNGSGAVGQVNFWAGKRPVQVEEPVFDLIDRALGFCKTSKGVFDITIGAVTVLPYYYQEKAEKEKAALVDYRKVKIDPVQHTVFLPDAGMALDLGGLAKGTVMDAAAQTLRRQGVPSALVEAGGDLYCYGNREWTVGIQDPRGEGMLGVIKVSNAGVCGSGDYYQYVITGDNGPTKRKHHILDPELLASAGKSIAVTVIAPSAELADALATTLFILGPEQGQLLLDSSPRCSALWVLPDRSLVVGKGFPALCSP